MSGFESIVAWVTAHYMELALVLLGAAEVARRVTALIPGKKDDEIAGLVERYVRKGVDLLAGVPRNPADPGLVKPDDSAGS